VVTYFTRAQSGSDKLAIKLAEIKGAFMGVLDVLAEIGENIWEGPLGTAIKKLWSIVEKIAGWLGKGIAYFAEDSEAAMNHIKQSAKDSADLKKNFLELDTWWEGNADKGIKGARILAAEYEARGEELRSMAEAETDIYRKNKLQKEAYAELTKGAKLREQYAERNYQLEYDSYMINMSGRADQKKLNDMEEEFNNKKKEAYTKVRELSNQIKASEKQITEEIKKQNLAREEALNKQKEFYSKYANNIEAPDLKGTKSIINEQIEKLNNELQAIKPGIDYSKAYEALQAFKKKVSLENLNNELNMALGQGIADSIDNIFSAIAEGGNVASAALESVGNMMKQFGSALVAYAVAIQAFHLAWMNPVLAISAGSALIAVGSVLSAIASKAQDFADGGIVYGETYARVAEYSGAKNNPEVIAPLNRLKSILGETSGDSGGVVKFEISGSNLVGTLNNYNRRVGRL
jgi:hypothetical protein